ARTRGADHGHHLAAVDPEADVGEDDQFARRQHHPLAQPLHLQGGRGGAMAGGGIGEQRRSVGHVHSGLVIVDRRRHARMTDGGRMKHGYAAWRLPMQWAIGLLALLALLPAFAQPASAAAPAQRTVLVMGDSLSAGYGMAAHEGWVSLLGERLAREKPGWRVVNASISGETTAGGSARIVGEVLRHRPD